VDIEASTSISAFVLQGVGSYPLNDEFDVLGRVGFAKWSSEAQARIPEVQFKQSDDDDGFDLIYGLGAAYKFSPQMSVRVEWERSEFDDLKVNMYSAGVTYKLQ
jgi:opacity protein-like surface antigen